MLRPEFVTFTGADDHTSLDGMRELSNRYPIEWGVLLSRKHEGLGRYPSRGRRQALAFEGRERRLRLALHVCGSAARDLFAFSTWPDVQGFARVQVNLGREVHSNDTLRLHREADARGPVTVVLQCRDGFPAFGGVHWLFDRSGGRGLEPSTWPPAPADTLVGYAGGIGPSNVARVLEAITVTPGAPSRYWIDMESGVRDAQDRFDLNACRAVCQAIWGERNA